MEVIALTNQKIEEPVCLMIGNFDGVHIGHQSIISQAKDLGREHHCKVGVLSFQPHPIKVLSPEKAPKLLRTSSQKKMLLAYHQLDYYFVQHFDKAFSKLSPEAFIKRLKDHINFKFILVGFNFRFGYQRSGNLDTLRELGKRFDYEVVIIQEQKEGGETISSTRIRKRVEEGHMEGLVALLGRPYFLEGEIQHGRALGRELKTPTANIFVENELLPKFGVYATWSRVEGEWFRSITNVGMAPTVERNQTCVETHLLNFNGELIYGRHIVLCFSHFIRAELKFHSIADLVEQIKKDIQQRLALADNQPPDFRIL